MSIGPGAIVSVRGGRWRVLQRTDFGDCSALELTNVLATERRTLLAPFDRLRPLPSSTYRAVSRKRWSRGVADRLRSAHPYGGLRFCPPRVHLLPYQLEPALAVLRHGTTRLLVADDVGLGKTVEAGLLVREVVEGDGLARVLVITPAALRAQWMAELSALFDVRATDADSNWLRRAAAELPQEVNPWGLPGVYVASMDFVKRPEALQALECTTWHLLVVDEAHAATANSHRYAAVHSLAQRARTTMLLTATPHSGDENQFAALCRIGSFPDSPPLAIFSRSRAEVAVPARPRRTVLLRVRGDGEEQRVRDRLEEYLSRLVQAPARRGELIASVLRKRALSSLQSLALSATRRLQILRGEAAPAQIPLPWDDDEIDDGAGDAGLSGGGLEDEREERAWLGEIAAAAARTAHCERKLWVLRRFLRRVKQPAIVFSEYRDTAHYLFERLADAGLAVSMLHGGMDPAERRAAVEAFVGGGRILVATDAASEGLNLHYRCRLVIHFDLPWVPTRLRQRCGRVDRIGQQRRVHEVALVVAHAAQAMVMGPLLRRAERAGPFAHDAPFRLGVERSGAGTEGAERVAVDGTFVRCRLEEEGKAEAARLECLRRLTPRAVAAARRTSDVLVTRWPRHRLRRVGIDIPGSALGILMLWTLESSAGESVDSVLLMVIVRDPGLGPDISDASAGRVEAMVASVSTALGSFVRARTAGQSSDVLRRRAAAESQRLRRRQAMHAHVSSAARRLVQAGLFDRRALRAARVRAALEVPLDTPSEGLPEESERIEARHAVVAVLLGDGR